MKQANQSLLTLAICFAVIVLFVVGGFALYSGAHDQAVTNHTVCVAVNNLNQVITETLHRSKRSIHNISYYKHHRRELRQQIREINQTLRLFRPRTCR